MDCNDVVHENYNYKLFHVTLAPGRPGSPVRPGSPREPFGPCRPDVPRSPWAPFKRRKYDLVS